ncbi:hypothetical protein AQ768_22165 [Burkholderia pseudomallei]|nr:hypothetical protein AQ768_22165 [Burkholderia pseudomallei]
MQDKSRIGEVSRHLLLDRATLLTPFTLSEIDAAHAKCLDMQQQINILGRGTRVILSNVVRGLCVEAATQTIHDRSNLIT